MLLGILGFVFSIMGIVGYFNEMPALVVISAVYIVTEAVIGLCTGELRSVATYIAAITIGFFIAVFTKSNIFLTIAVALCFEELVLGIVAGIAFVAIGFAENKPKKANNIAKEENKTDDIEPDTYNPDAGNLEIKPLQDLFEQGVSLQPESTPVVIHNLSTKHGYYKDEMAWDEESDSYIRRWIDKDTNSIYNIVDEVNGEIESITVTKDIFETMHAKFYKNHDYHQVSLLDAITAEPPILDINGLAFADEETQQKELSKYAEDIYEYVKCRMKNEDLL